MKKSVKKEVKKYDICKKVLIFILCMVIVFIVALLGGLFTGPGVASSWYQETRPAITPPNFVFPIAWTILFFLIGLSLFLSWIGSNKKNKKKIAVVFVINFVLNILWSVLYFGLRSPLLAFIEIIILWLSILAMILVLWKINKTAAWLLVPYIAWVTFAAVLTLLSVL